MLGQDVVPRGERGRLRARAARRDRSRRGGRRDRTRRRGHQLRRLDRRRRRRGARGRGAAREPRRRPQRRRGRRHRRLRLERLRLRRHQGRAVPRVGPGQPAVGLRAHQARRRARHRGGQPAPPDRPLLLAVRRGREATSSRRCSRLGPEVRVVDDQVGCPTFTGHLAEALAELARSEDFGVHHVAASGSCSWFEFAREIFARAGAERASSPARPPSSRARRPGPPTRCSPASAATGCPPGSRASTRTSG